MFLGRRFHWHTQIFMLATDFNKTAKVLMAPMKIIARLDKGFSLLLFPRDDLKFIAF
jgi:hypothetical protein